MAWYLIDEVAELLEEGEELPPTPDSSRSHGLPTEIGDYCRTCGGTGMVHRADLSGAMTCVDCKELRPRQMAFNAERARNVVAMLEAMGAKAAPGQEEHAGRCAGQLFSTFEPCPWDGPGSVSAGAFFASSRYASDPYPARSFESCTSSSVATPEKATPAATSKSPPSGKPAHAGDRGGKASR